MAAHGLASPCPAGCNTHLCAFNQDPHGELDILRRTKHYSPAHAIDALLQSVGIFLPVAASAESSTPLRRKDFHAAIDRVIVEYKNANRSGGREDLGRYDERFNGIFVRWVPMAADTPDGRRMYPGAPHAILVEYRGPVNTARTLGGAPMQGTGRFQGQVWTSGQVVRLSP